MTLSIHRRRLDVGLEWEPSRSGGGVYGKGMHDFVLREMEVGWCAAAGEDDEYCGFGPLFDRLVDDDIKANPERWGLA